MPVDLPKTKAGQINADQAPLVVTIKKDGVIFLQDNEIEAEKLIPRLAAIGDANKDVRIFVRGDKQVAYGEVIVLMGRIQSAGFERASALWRNCQRNRAMMGLATFFYLDPASGSVGSVSRADRVIGHGRVAIFCRIRISMPSH